MKTFIFIPDTNKKAGLGHLYRCFKYSNFVNKKYKIIFLILICFTWTPKAVYHEDISSLPLYRTIVKTKYFIGNFKNFSENSL